jgi:hypothetical protein
MLFLVAQRNADTEDPAAGDLHRVGVVAGSSRSRASPTGRPEFSWRASPALASPVTCRPPGHLRAALADETAPSIRTRPSPGTRSPRAVAVRGIRWSAPSEFRVKCVALIQGAESIARQAYGIAAHLAVRVEVRQNCSRPPTFPSCSSA